MKPPALLKLIALAALILVAIGLLDALAIISRPVQPWFAWMLP